VSRMVIGHTPTGGAVLPRYGGKVLLIDVGISRVYGGRRHAWSLRKVSDTSAIAVSGSTCPALLAWRFWPI
jgi:hypothetical protein